MLDSLPRRPRLHPLAGRLTRLPWLAAAVRRGGGLPTAGEIRARVDTERAATAAATRTALLRLVDARNAVPAPMGHPVSLELAERLPESARERLTALVGAEPGWNHDPTVPEQLAQVLVQAGMHYADEDAIAATGLRPHLPPEDVHAMDRGHRTAAGSLEIADLVAASLEQSGRPIGDGDTVLDFGSSSGRVLAPLAAWRPGARWIGCDPNPDAIAWAAENVTAGEFFLSPELPPLDLEPASVDVAVAISIWSHYAEPAAITWLEEMHRVVKPGGRLLLTTHGAHSLSLYQRVYRETEGRVGLNDDHILEAQAALARDRYWWFDAFGAAGDWGVDTPTWGHAHYLPEWVIEQVTPNWSVALYREAVYAGNQDVYALTRAE